MIRYGNTSQSAVLPSHPLDATVTVGVLGVHRPVPLYWFLTWSLKAPFGVVAAMARRGWPPITLAGWPSRVASLILLMTMMPIPLIILGLLPIWLVTSPMSLSLCLPMIGAFTRLTSALSLTNAFVVFPSRALWRASLLQPLLAFWFKLSVLGSFKGVIQHDGKGFG